ncbi:MAG: Crp/Fnr family transcriptional regulator [Oligoflexales bacterium]|nr:Crp/Fnr family transcriptional regulator [Oligoflexales bacterium]
MDIAKFLSKVFMFEPLKGDDLHRIANSSSLVRLSRNKVLFEEGEDASHLYIVAHGKVSIYKVSIAGGEQVLHITSAGGSVAEAAVLNRKKYPAGCKALEDSLLVRIPGSVFIDTIIRNPENAIRVLTSYSQKLREFVDMIEYLSLNSVMERVVIYLIKNSISAGGSYECRLDVPKKRLASLLGTIPETLSRTLKKIKDEGIIEERGKVIAVKDMDRLKDSLHKAR